MKQPTELIEYAKRRTSKDGGWDNYQYAKEDLDKARTELYKAIAKYKQVKEDYKIQVEYRNELIEWLKSIGEYEAGK